MGPLYVCKFFTFSDLATLCVSIQNVNLLQFFTAFLRAWTILFYSATYFFFFPVCAPASTPCCESSTSRSGATRREGTVTWWSWSSWREGAAWCACQNTFTCCSTAAGRETRVWRTPTLRQPPRRRQHHPLQHPASQPRRRLPPPNPPPGPEQHPGALPMLSLCCASQSCCSGGKMSWCTLWCQVS